jgi:hypothetical protein
MRGGGGMKRQWEGRGGRNPALTLCASYLPLPPPLPAPAPLSQALALIVTLVNLTRGTQGCPKIISLDKVIGILTFDESFQSSFSPLLYTRTFSQLPLLKKCTPFFPSVNNPRILLQILSSPIQFFIFP